MAGRAAPQGRTSVTIRDVARRAEVSIATVSRVLRGTAPVAGPTRDRVLEAVDELRFTPSSLGRSLAERRHAANGIVFPDLSGPYYAEVVLGYEAVAADRNRSVLICSTHGRDAARERVLDLAGRVDGLVVLCRTVSDDVVAEIAARGLPLVLLARQAADSTVDSVNADSVASAVALAEHLVAAGHRDLMLLGSPASAPDVAVRWTGLRRTWTAAGIPAPRMVEAGFSEHDGARAAGRLLADRPSHGLPDAVVCANDELALGLMGALRDAGLDVPGDIAVTGWDDVMAARYAGLTTVRQPMRELGVTAARTLDARIGGDDGPPRHLLLPTELVVRTSSSPPPKTPLNTPLSTSGRTPKESR